MGWFQRKDAALPRPLLPLWAGAGDFELFPRSYEARLAEVFVQNPVGQRAVRMVAGAAGSLTVYARSGDERAAGLVRAGGLIETLATQILLHGNSYVQVIAGADGAAELFALRPERVAIELDERGWPAAYGYKVGARASRIAARDALGRAQIVHVRSVNPADDHHGLGCLDAAIGAAAIHNRASRWNKALLDNAARPSGALVYEPGDGSSLTGEQFVRLKNEMDSQFAGSVNAGRPLLLEGGLKWQALSLSPADMDFVGLKAAAARDIALAFGVPPMLLGLPGDAAYANYREAGRALYRQTVLPLAGLILGALGKGLSDWFGPVELAADVDQISELAEDRERLWTQVGAASFLSDAEKREMLGYSAEEQR